MPRKYTNKYIWLGVVGWFWALILKLKIKTLIEKLLREKHTVENRLATNRIKKPPVEAGGLIWLFIKETSSF